MKKIFVFITLLFLQHIAVAQDIWNEYEPNDTEGDAGQFNTGIIMQGTIGNGDNADWFRMPMTSHGNLWVRLELTNNGDDDIDINVTINPSYGTLPVVTRTISIPSGETITEWVQACGRAADDYYLSLENSGAEIEYQLQWYAADAATSRPNNNTRGTAEPFTMSSITPVQGGINYTKYDRPVFPNLGSNDRFEYFKTTITVADPENYNLYIKANNYDCLPAGTLAVQLYYRLYRNGETTAFTE